VISVETKKQALALLDQREILEKRFRIYGDIENLLFYAKDVAEWIDYNQDNCGMYKVSEKLESIDDNEKGKCL